MKYFFITSLGRSGTNFFSNLLNQSNEVLCLHEPYRQDYTNLSLSYYAEDLKVLEDSLINRFQDVKTKLASTENFKYYGEVNSLLRYNTQWLKKNLNANIVHIVRDPKKVVPSIYVRNTYTSKDSHLAIVPKNSNPYANKWQDMSRFEKICWYWNHTNQMLLNNVDKVFRFEELISDYDTFLRMVNYLEIPVVSKNIWLSEVSKPRNTTKQAVLRKKIKSLIRNEPSHVEKIGEYNEWTTEMKNSFISICGETANKLGYEL